jgi:hypothetical protein
MAGGDPPGPDARCHRAAHRGHRRPATPLPRVTVDVDSGYQGLARDFPGQVTAPPAKPKTGATPGQVTEREAARKQQSSRRICIEHAIAEPKQWRTMQRYIGRRQYFDDTALAIAGLVSDRTAER